MIFTRIALARRPASSLALAVALATGAAVGATAFASPAMAAQKDKKDGEESGGGYSDEFRAIYAPLAELTKSETADVAALKAQLPALVAVTASNDEKMAAGSAIFEVGKKASDQTLQLQGLELMLASEKVPAENVALYNFLTGQLAFNMKDYAKSRSYVQSAIDAGYTDNDPQVFIAETYFSEGNHAEGLKLLTAAIEARQAAGQPVNEDWIRRGLAMAYNNKMTAEAGRYALLFATEYPSDVSWGDAVAITLNTSKYDAPAVLDLLRLARLTNAFSEPNLYYEYIEAADYRRMPGEVVEIIDAGYASGKLPKSDTNLAEIRKEAQSRAATDRADLPKLIASARSDSGLRNVVIAADLALSYDQPADAEALYTRALGMAGVDKALVLTRLGIAQVDQGKFTEAQASFAKVEGPRKAIADLWAAYAAQKGAGATAQ